MKLLFLDEALRVPGCLSDVPELTDIFAATSISQAKKLLQTEQIDLYLLSDCISDGDSLALLQTAHQPVFAILSHKPSLDFAIRAMTLGASDYLALPSTDEQFLAVIRRMIFRIHQIQNADHWEQAKAIVHSAFWQALVGRRVPMQPEALSQTAKQYDIEIPSTVFPVYLRYRSRSDGPTIEPLLQCREFAPLSVQTVNLGNRTMLLLFLNQQQLAPISEYCKKLLSACREQHIDALGILGETCSCMELPEQAVQMQQAGQNHVYLDNHLLPSAPGQPLMTTPPQPNVEKLLTLLDCGMFEETMDTAKQFFFNPDVVPQVNAHFLENYKYQLLDGLRNLELARKSSANILANIPSDLMAQASASVQDFLELLNAICTVLKHLAESESDQRNLVAEIQIYILEHLDCALTRNSIAAHFYISADHLDRVFKRECGQTVTDYIQQERIALSKQLLTGSALSISDVAAKVGFVNFSHFSSVFKRSTGLTPFLYRKQHGTE